MTPRSASKEKKMSFFLGEGVTAVVFKLEETGGSTYFFWSN